MNKQNIEYLKEKLKLETDRFKTYVFLVAALAGALGSLILIEHALTDIKTKSLIIIGFIFLLFFTFAVIYSYIVSNKTLKKMSKLK